MERREQNKYKRLRKKTKQNKKIQYMYIRAIYLSFSHVSQRFVLFFDLFPAFSQNQSVLDTRFDSAVTEFIL